MCIRDRLRGLEDLIAEKTGINTMTAEDPMTAVAIGTLISDKFSKKIYTCHTSNAKTYLLHNKITHYRICGRGGDGAHFGVRVPSGARRDPRRGNGAVRRPDGYPFRRGGGRDRGDPVRLPLCAHLQAEE